MVALIIRLFSPGHGVIPQSPNFPIVAFDLLFQTGSSGCMVIGEADNWVVLVSVQGFQSKRE